MFVKADLFETDFSKATVITMFLLPDINLKLRPKILDLKPGTRIVSNSFTMGDWKADQTDTVEDNCTSYCTALLGSSRRRSSGTWTASGRAQAQAGLPVRDRHLKGSQPAVTPRQAAWRPDSFTAGSTRYEGKVTGKRIEGTATSGGNSTKWSASR